MISLCRDWTELWLKEGLTTFRERLFRSTLGSAAAQRIEDVKRLTNVQYAEDLGPLSHSIRPESYISVNNMHTSTVYWKGAEVARM